MRTSKSPERKGRNLEITGKLRVNLMLSLLERREFFLINGALLVKLRTLTH